MRRPHYRLVMIIAVILLAAGFLAFGTVNRIEAKTSSTAPEVEISSRGNGWDVKVTWFIARVNIAQVKFTGGSSKITATYPQPYIVKYEFNVNNQECGGDQDPITGQYQFPNRGYAWITIIYPLGTWLGAVGEMEWFGRTNDCADDGGINFIPNPVLVGELMPAITESIWTRIELPELEIQANPMTGLVTIPEWFWLQLKSNKQWWPGTDPSQGGQPFGVSVSIPLPGQTQTVEVLADVTKATWNFGDNGQKALKSSTLVGKAYPIKSNVQHPYNTAEVFKPSILLHFVPRYAWNGGSWVQLENLFRESLWEGEVRIKEAQTVLVEPDRPSFPG